MLSCQSSHQRHAIKNFLFTNIFPFEELKLKNPNEFFHFQFLLQWNSYPGCYFFSLTPTVSLFCFFSLSLSRSFIDEMMMLETDALVQLLRSKYMVKRLAIWMHSKFCSIQGSTKWDDVEKEKEIIKLWWKYVKFICFVFLIWLNFMNSGGIYYTNLNFSFDFFLVNWIYWICIYKIEFLIKLNVETVQMIFRPVSASDQSEWMNCLWNIMMTRLIKLTEIASLKIRAALAINARRHPASSVM